MNLDTISYCVTCCAVSYSSKGASGGTHQNNNRPIFNMICPYCNSSLYSNFSISNGRGPNKTFYEIFPCNNCSIEFALYPNDLKISQISSINKNIRFTFCFNYSSNKTSLWKHGENDTNFSMLWKEFPQILNVNPYNIHNKLQTILVFS